MMEDGPGSGAGGEARDRTPSASLDVIALFSSLVALLCIALIGSSLNGHEWLRGTALVDKTPQKALVSLHKVRFAINNWVEAADAGTGQGDGFFLNQAARLKDKCGDDPKLALPRGDDLFADTHAAVWCQLRRAGGRTRTLLWLGYIPLWAACLCSFVLGLSNQWAAAKNVRYALNGYGVDDAVLNGIVMSTWVISWAFLLVAMATYVYSAPTTLGWGPVTFEASFGVLQLTFIVMTMTASILAAKMFSLWVCARARAPRERAERGAAGRGSAAPRTATLGGTQDDDNMRDAYNDFADSAGLRKGVYLLLFLQLLGYLLCSVRRVEWQALICLFGLYYLDTDKVNFLLIYVVLTGMSVLFDTYRMGMAPHWGQMTGSEGFASGCYLAVLALKPVVLGGLVLVRRQDKGASLVRVARRRDRAAAAARHSTG